MFSRILVGLDKSEVSHKLMVHAIFLAKPLNARLNLIHVVTGDEPGYPALPTSIHIATINDLGINNAEQAQYAGQSKSFIQEYRDWLNGQAAQAEAEGIETECHQRYGTAGQTLCQAAQEWSADLILLGTHGRSGLSELLLGSVSNYVMHHAPCSVLIVHKQATAP